MHSIVLSNLVFTQEEDTYVCKLPLRAIVITIHMKNEGQCDSISISDFSMEGMKFPLYSASLNNPHLLDLLSRHLAKYFNTVFVQLGNTRTEEELMVARNTTLNWIEAKANA